MEFTQVLLSPVVTEKSAKAQEKRQYLFLVRPNANKIEIANAVEKSYGVKVTNVNTIPVRKKVRMIGRGREMTKRHPSKKAIVTVAPKQSIDFSKVKTSR